MTLLFLLYAAQIFDIIVSFGLSVHTYADDSQLYISSACQHPNHRCLQPSWPHMWKDSINGCGPTD